MSFSGTLLSGLLGFWIPVNAGFTGVTGVVPAAVPAAPSPREYVPPAAPDKPLRLVNPLFIGLVAPAVPAVVPVCDFPRKNPRMGDA